MRTVDHRTSPRDTTETLCAADAAPAVHFASHLNSSDALLWNIEKDPCLRTTIVAISLLDRSPDWDRLVERVIDAVAAVPRLRQRVVAAPLRMGLPRWQDDDDFDITYHLRRVVAPTPGDLRAVLDVAGPIAMASFDKDRPLWEFTLVEGLAGGRAAFIQKVHHSFTDGVGAMRLAKLLLDTSRKAVRRRHRPAEGHQRASSSVFAVAAESLADEVRSAVRAPTRIARAVPGLAVKAATDPMGFTRSAARSVRSVGRLLAPASAPLSPTMTGRGLSRRLETFDVPLADLLAAAHAAACSLNDAFLAGVAGGMRLYHERHGAPVEFLRVTMPINLRHDDDDLGNNRFTPVRFALPVATVDASERMRQVGELAKKWRREPALPLTDVIAGVLDRLPVVATTTLFGSMLKGVDFVATNVPGLTGRSFLAGAEVIREYAFAPPSGAAFSVALLSHGDSCCIGINADGAAVPDIGVLAECLALGFAEVLEVGGAS
jgi:diacylglycerol O-acyltransferase / wax synthase